METSTICKELLVFVKSMCFGFYSRFRINSLLCFILFVIFSIITNRTFHFLSPQVVNLVELSTCPVCYGTTACDHIFNENFIIQPFDFHSLLSHLFNRKNVFYGTINGTRVVIKKLAHSYELNAFDDMLCQNIEFKKFCRKEQKYNDNEVNSNSNIDFFDKITTAVSPKFFGDDESGLVLCPTTSHLKKVINQLEVDDIHLWTLIKINPEPLILQMLQADEGWPVAKYYGACGRTVVEEYVGPPLTAYYNEPWYRRARIAINLLEAAHMFTFHSPDFSFYLTDLSADNIAIDQNDAPKFIDLENVIILNRDISEKEKPKNWYDLHQSENIIDCDDCFSFSPMDICSHSLSDHNYFAICQKILAYKSNTVSDFDGFLHNIPEKILNDHRNLQKLLNECVSPKNEKSRISAGIKLKNLLEAIIIELNVTHFNVN